MELKVKSSKLKRRGGGFTLIELVLYLAIVSIFLVSLVPFAWDVIGGSVKSSAQREVFSQARVISERIKYEIRNASGINSVAAGNISLAESNPATDPTVIDLAAGKIRIKQGAGVTLDLNSDDTSVTALTFTDYTSADNKTKHIQFNFTIDDNYSGARQEYEVPAVTIESGAELRSN